MKPAIEKKGQEFWIAHCKQWEGSGESQEVYCRIHGIKFSTFQYYRHRYLLKSQPRTTPLNFVEIQEKPKAVQPPSCLQLMLPNGVKLSIPMDTSENLLKMVITVVGQIRC